MRGQDRFAQLLHGDRHDHGHEPVDDPRAHHVHLRRREPEPGREHHAARRLLASLHAGGGRDARLHLRRDACRRREPDEHGDGRRRGARAERQDIQRHQARRLLERARCRPVRDRPRHRHHRYRHGGARRDIRRCPVQLQQEVHLRGRGREPQHRDHRRDGSARPRQRDRELLRHLGHEGRAHELHAHVPLGHRQVGHARAVELLRRATRARRTTPSRSTKDAGTDSSVLVTGTITIHNPAPMAATITDVSDYVSPRDRRRACEPAVLPDAFWLPGETTQIAYTAALPDTTDRTNTATATLRNHDYDWLRDAHEHRDDELHRHVASRLQRLRRPRSTTRSR